MTQNVRDIKSTYLHLNEVVQTQLSMYIINWVWIPLNRKKYITHKKYPTLINISR